MGIIESEVRTIQSSLCRATKRRENDNHKHFYS